MLYKNGKAWGTTDEVVSEMGKNSEETAVQQISKTSVEAWRSGDVPDNWTKSLNKHENHNFYILYYN